MPLADYDYFVRYISLPLSCGGFVMANDDGTYSIYLNSNHPDWKQRETLEHEIKHIINGDLFSSATMAEVENW